MAKKGQTFKKVSLEQRLWAVKERIEEEKTYQSIGDKYGVSKKTVETWVRIYQRDHGLDVQKKGRPTEKNQIIRNGMKS